VLAPAASKRFGCEADPGAFGREGEGEEESSVMLDDGMNDLAAVQAKFAKFDEEKQVRDRW
jgi:hypothetical protein